MVATWSDSEDDFIIKKNEKEVANMCFMDINELDEVNSNPSYKDLQEACKELYRDHEKLGLKNVLLKKNIQSLEKKLKDLQGKFSNVENVNSKCMHCEFEMSMMAKLNYFLGIQIKKLKDDIFINQEKYINLLKRFKMKVAKTMGTN